MLLIIWHEYIRRHEYKRKRLSKDMPYSNHYRTTYSKKSRRFDSSSSDVNIKKIHHKDVADSELARRNSRQRPVRFGSRSKRDELTNPLNITNPSSTRPVFIEDEDDEENDHPEPAIASSDIEEVQCQCSVHDKKSDYTMYLDNVYYISVDSAFNMLFMKSDFYHQVLKRRDARDFKCGSWQNVPSEGTSSMEGGGEGSGRGGKRKQQRELTYIMPTNSNVPIAPKTVACTEMQYVDPAEFIEKKLYSAHATVRNHSKFSDSFIIHTKYCLTRNSRQRFRLQLFSKTEFVKWVMMKDIIREQVEIGMRSHCEALDKALQLKISESKIAPNAGLSRSASTSLRGGNLTQQANSNNNHNDASERSDSANNLNSYPNQPSQTTRRRPTVQSAVSREMSIHRDRTFAFSNDQIGGSGAVEELVEHMPGGGSTLGRQRSSVVGGTYVGGLGSAVQQVASSSVVKGLVVMLLLLASISHSMLIYQLSNISHISRSLPESTNPEFDLSKFQQQQQNNPSSEHSQFDSSNRESSSSSRKASQHSNEHKNQQSNQQSPDSEFTSQQLMSLIVNSHIQQQNQFQQIMKNSLTVLEVMTNNMNSINMLVSSQMAQQGSFVNEFAKSVNKNKENNEESQKSGSVEQSEQSSENLVKLKSQKGKQLGMKSNVNSNQNENDQIISNSNRNHYTKTDLK